MTFNQAKSEEAQRKGAIMGHDNDYHTTTVMTAAEVNENNKEFWGGSGGNIGPASAPEAARDARSIPVYRGMMAADEVSPTQSDPPDARGDNLLERGGGGIPGTEDDLSEGEEARDAPQGDAEPNNEHLRRVSKKMGMPKPGSLPSSKENERSKDGVASAARVGAEVGRKVAEGHVVDGPKLSERPKQREELEAEARENRNKVAAENKEMNKHLPSNKK